MNKKLILLLLLFSSPLFSQYNGKKYSIGFNALYTTTSKIFLFPNSSDKIIRNKSNDIDKIFNYGLEFRYRFLDDIIFTLNAEYLKASQGGINITGFVSGSTVAIKAEDGFELIPVELSVFYELPFSTDEFKFLMGGGGGVYFGNHLRKVGSVEVNNISREIAYGIQVALTMQYLINENISVQFGFKFRDPDFRLTSQYTSPSVQIGNDIVTFPQDKFDSRINVDGVTFTLGAFYDF